jgi:hypothetical protein
MSIFQTDVKVNTLTLIFDKNYSFIFLQDPSWNTAIVTYFILLLQLKRELADLDGAGEKLEKIKTDCARVRKNFMYTFKVALAQESVSLFVLQTTQSKTCVSNALKSF